VTTRRGPRSRASALERLLKPEVIVWGATAQIFAHARRKDGRYCMVNVVCTSPSAGRWSLLALETESEHLVTDAVLENHAHQPLGHFPDLPSAITVATVWLEGWLANATPPAPACPCEPIDP